MGSGGGSRWGGEGAGGPGGSVPAASILGPQPTAVGREAAAARRGPSPHTGKSTLLVHCRWRVDEQLLRTTHARRTDASAVAAPVRGSHRPKSTRGNRGGRFPAT